MNKTKLLILLTVFIDVIGIGIVIPILPFYVQGFGASAFLITSLFAVYALCSFLSAPVIGALSDKVGRRPMLIMSIFSTAIGWVIFALAPSILFLFIGRIIDGLAAGNLPIAQAYLADLSKDDQERSANFGLIGMIFGIAFIVGPFLGGVLGSISHTFPFWFVGVLACINGILAFIQLPETHIHRVITKKVSINPFTPLRRALQNKIILPNYIAWLFFGLAIASFQSVFALYVGRVFGFGEFTVGLLFAGTGIVIALNQGFILKQFWLKRFKEPFLELGMLFVFALGLLLMSVPYMALFIVALILTTFGQSILRVVMTSQIVSQADASIKGEVLGTTSSITSLSMAIAPLVAGVFFDYGSALPFIVAAVCMLVAFVVLYHKRLQLRKISLLEDTPIISEI